MVLTFHWAETDKKIKDIQELLVLYREAECSGVRESAYFRRCGPKRTFWGATFKLTSECQETRPLIVGFCHSRKREL